jgi:UTP:GlnB (protein PII) uridylyltransferase
MEDVLGGYTADNLFAAFLGNWEPILNRRVAEAAAAFSQVKGLDGLILAGGLGRGEPWPLSDIDLIPIYDADHLEAAAAEIETLRVAFLERWVAEGWWSGLDIGRLRFTTSEVRQAL